MEDRGSACVHRKARAPLSHSKAPAAEAGRYNGARSGENLFRIWQVSDINIRPLKSGGVKPPLHEEIGAMRRRHHSEMEGDSEGAEEACGKLI